jgi:hypothetical protein
MTRSERILFHQIHPLKLGTDVVSAYVSLYFFWQHRLLIGLLMHFGPPVLTSALTLTFASLEAQKRSALGVYVSRMMTRTVEAIRLVGDLVMVFGAWHRSVVTIVAGLIVVLAAWASGLPHRRTA